MVAKGKKKDIRKVTSNRWFWVLSIALISISSVSLYHKSVNNALLDIDDRVIFVNNYSFLKKFSNAPKVFTQGVFQGQGAKDTGVSDYRPLLMLSFMIDAQIAPANNSEPLTPKPFLISNIFYHIIACILLLAFLTELTIPPIPSLLLSLIFTVHPMLNQAVAWIPGRNDPLLAIFIISSMLFLLKYLKSKKWEQFAFHILFFVLALFTKESAVMLIPVVLIILWLSFFKNAPQEKLSLLKEHYKKLGLSYILCIIPWLLLRNHALEYNRNISTPSDTIHNFLVNSPYFIQYAGKAIFPFNLALMATPSSTNYLLELLVIGLLAVFIYLSKEKNMRLVIMGVAWYILFLAPTFSISFTGLEHRTYIPLIGIIMVVSQLDWVKRAGLKAKEISSIMGFIILGVVFLVFYSISHSRLPDFRDRFTFDKSAMESSPQYKLPWTYLAKEYEGDGDYPCALEAYREALKQDSTQEMIHNDVAGEYMNMKMYPEAENELRIEVSKYPANSIALFNLGLLIFKESRNYNDCISLLKRAIVADSSFMPPYQALSQVYASMGDTANAVLYRNLYFKKKS